MRKFAILLGLFAAFMIAGSSVQADPVSEAKTTEEARAAFLKTFQEPDWDAGADEAVKAEEGGKGFGEWALKNGWQTDNTHDLIGDPRAVKGGELIFRLESFPATVQYIGKDGNTTTTNLWFSMTHETLLSLHPVTLKPMPGLATHWMISEDKMTYWFRINPSARWSDGSPVTTKDVISTWELYIDEGIEDPSHNDIYKNKMEKPVAESKYIVRFQAKEYNWLVFNLCSSSFSVMPDKVLSRITGKQFISKFQFEQMMGSGPYMIPKEEIKKDESLVLVRRKDYWAENARRNIGTANFDRIKFVHINNKDLAYERLKNQEIDILVENQALKWVKELNFTEIENGWIRKRKIFTDSLNWSGYAFNMRKEPFDDIRVRKAFVHLIDISKLNQLLFFDQYVPCTSYFGGMYANPDNPTLKYDPEAAKQLLEEAGWKRNETTGILEKDGKPFEFDMTFDGTPQSERIQVVIQEDLQKAGIKMNLRKSSWADMWKDKMEHNFVFSQCSWRNTVFPNPEGMWHSKFADLKDNNNIGGFAKETVDKLCEEYNKEFDLDKRIKLCRQIDKLIFEEYPYMLGWYAPYERLVYWNKFGHPDNYLNRMLAGDQDDVATLWWFDPKQDVVLQEAVKNNAKLEAGPTDIEYWVHFSKRQNSNK